MKNNKDFFIENLINNNNLITIEPKNTFNQAYKLNLIDMKSIPVSSLYNFHSDKEIILKEYKGKSGIYLIHNNINGKEYIGSAIDLRKRLATYYFPSRLLDNRYISNSIIKYGHINFSLVILYVSDNKNINIINEEQKYIDLYKPILNINPIAGSSLGFKHTEESKKLISEFRKGKPLSDETKKKLSIMFSGELNPF